MESMKIIHYIPALSRRLGGVAMYIQLLAKELGRQCELIVVTRPFDNPLELENCRVVNIPIPKTEFQKAWSDFLEVEKPDLVHINGVWQLDTWWVQKEALRRGIKTYITPHGMLEPWSIQHNHWKKLLAMFLYEKKALKSAQNLVATAESEKNNLLKLKVTKNDIPVIPNGIDVSKIEIKQDWSIKKKILYVSRIHIKKGVELLIETLLLIKDYLDDYEIIIAGEGETEYVESLKKKALASGLNINFVGGIYGEKKWQMFRDADFFVLPTNSENFGYVIAEALASGTPVITTKGTPWQELNTCNCGCWIDRTIDELKNTILDFLRKNPAELEFMGRNGRMLIEKNYSAKAMADELIKVYSR